MAVKRKVKSDRRLGKSVATQKTGQPLEVSQSTIKNWRRCHALYDYRFVQLIRRRRPIVQFVRGTMIGKCLDAFALERMNPKKYPANVNEVLKPYEDAYGKMFADEQEYYGPVIDEVKRIVHRYKEVYANDELKYELAGGDGGPFEYPVNVELAPGVVFTGHIDKIPVDKQGRVWDMDHKSHKSIPETDDRFRDLQQLFYCWAMPLSGYPTPIGVIWDYLRTKPPVVPDQLKRGGLSQRKNMDTDYETYFAEVKRLGLNPADYKEMADILKPRGTMDFYLRVPMASPPKVLINNVVADARTTALEIKQKGGVDKVRMIDRTCKGCEFYSLCQAEFRGVDTDYIRKTEYEVNPEPRHVHVMDED